MKNLCLVLSYRDDCEIVTHTKSDIAPVGYLKVSKYHLEPKPNQVLLYDRDL